MSVFLTLELLRDSVERHRRFSHGTLKLVSELIGCVFYSALTISFSSLMLCHKMGNSLMDSVFIHSLCFDPYPVGVAQAMFQNLSAELLLVQPDNVLVLEAWHRPSMNHLMSLITALLVRQIMIPFLSSHAVSKILKSSCALIQMRLSFSYIFSYDTAAEPNSFFFQDDSTHELIDMTCPKTLFNACDPGC